MSLAIAAAIVFHRITPLISGLLDRYRPEAFTGSL